MTVETRGDDEGRLSALHRYRLPAEGPHEALERIARIAQVATGAPIAAISVIDRYRQTFLAARGIAAAPIAREEAICALALEGAGPVAIEDAAADPRTARLDLVAGEPGVRAYLGIPLMSGDGYVLGTLAVMDTRPRRFSEDDVTVAVNLARLAMTTIEARQVEDFDYLTGAMTRRRFQAEVEREYARAVRYERPAVLIFLDVDGFDRANAMLGPANADQVLRSVANRAVESIRSSDSFGRIGGEEFGMLLPETLAYEAGQCAERLREEISRLRFKDENGILAVTASFGVAPLRPSIRSAAQWFAQADIALYAAKQAGRNCVAFAPDVAEEPGLTRGDDGRELSIQRLH